MKVQEPVTKCPKCGGEVWDNRGKKKTPKSPDWKCKDKNCDTPVWLDEKSVATTNGKHPDAAYTWSELGNAYAKSHQIAKRVVGTDMSPEALVAATATVFIKATQLGLKAEE